MKITTLTIAPLFFITSCAKHDRNAHYVHDKRVYELLFTRTEYGDDWPYKKDSLYLFRGEEADIYAERNDTIYAINSVADDKVDSGNFSAYPMNLITISALTNRQIATKETIEKIGGTQIVNEFPRNY